MDSDTAKRMVIVRGPADAVNKAFNVTLNDYEFERGQYRSHDGAVNLPSSVAGYVEAVVGLTNRQVHARHYSTAKRRATKDPANTQPLTPGQVAKFYDFPDGDGAGQTIGLYEMQTQEGPAGYAKSDIAATMEALGGLPVPNIIDVSVDDVNNSGQPDGETGLDITVAGALAPKATIAVYFTGGETQNILHSLQTMIRTTKEVRVSPTASSPSSPSYSRTLRPTRSVYSSPREIRVRRLKAPLRHRSATRQAMSG